MVGVNLMTRFDDLVAEATAQKMTGWDFSWLAGRWEEADPPWDYTTIVRRYTSSAQGLLDMGTGGGEWLASLTERPAFTVATEAYAPNVGVAAQRLRPLDIPVVHAPENDQLPFEDDSFDLVINRHNSFDTAEVHRILSEDGVFITQQVGARDNIGLNEALQENVELSYPHNTLIHTLQDLRDTGFIVIQADETFSETRFFDIGAIVYYLRVIEWQIPDFTVNAYRPALQRLHQQIETEGRFTTQNHRFIVAARKGTV